MTQQCGWLVEGSRKDEEGRRRKRKNQYSQRTFSPAWKREGIYCGGMMIYVRGGRAVRVRRGWRCEPIMINALHPGDCPACSRPESTPTCATPSHPSSFLWHRTFTSCPPSHHACKLNVDCSRQVKPSTLSDPAWDVLLAIRCGIHQIQLH